MSSCVKNIAILFLTVVIPLSAKGQINDYKSRIIVLEKAIIDSVFVFGEWNDKGETETSLKYLGSVKTTKGKTYKIMTSVWTWGLSRRATSRILIYNEKNIYVGDYYLSSVDDLPSKLKDGKLLFQNVVGSDCDKTLITLIDLRKGLPTQFFRKCNGDFGDVYRFSSE